MGLRQSTLEAMVNQMNDFYKGKRVLVTGHTGFKGAWLCRILDLLGAKVFGYALEPPTNPNLYTLLKSDEYVNSEIGDIADFVSLSDYYQEVMPSIVIHLAAQPIVIEGYAHPRETYLTNVMGTANICECIRLYGAKSFLNVTTDKVYYNDESDHYYKEEEILDGFDPYSNSKSCSELVTATYKRSFANQMCPTSTARAGNVIGGGDFAINRIIPDCIRAAIESKEVILRNPNSIRPYQHVLEPLFSYLKIASMQAINPKYEGNYNIGPDKNDCVTTGEIADLFCKYWGNNMCWKSSVNGGPHEANYLKLDNNKIKNVFGITPVWHVDKAIQKTVEWTKEWISGKDVRTCIDLQIKEYFSSRNITL